MTRVCLLLALPFALTGVAHADIISMSEANCRKAARGDACQGDTAPGTCQPGRCCRNDYSDGPPPKTVCRDCLKCQPAGAEEPAPAPAAPETPTPAAPTPAAPTPAAPAAEAPAADTPAAEKPTPEATPAEPAEKSGCEAGPPDRPFGWGVLALGLLLAIGLRRSRR